MKIIINGYFISQHITGIQRYALELTSALDEIVSEDEIEIAIPPNVKSVPEYKNIKIVKVGRFHKTLWENISFPLYVKNKKGIPLNFCNTAPFFIMPGITAVHDIMYKTCPSYYTTFRNRLSRYWHMLQYWYITRHEKKIITVSNFSKCQIEKYYPASTGKITVIPSAWQHILRCGEDPKWQEKYPFLIDKEYFFSLSTLSKNKNHKWIIDVAKRNSNHIFAIAGKTYENENCEIPSNVHMLGYVSDDTVCSLMQHCKAFIFPSLCEGFGLPPLEALALGADVIISNTSSLPEVFRGSAHYVNPYDTSINIEDVLTTHVEEKNKVLSIYDWKKSASMLYSLLKEEIKL